MNYLQYALLNAQKGNQGFLTHIGYAIGQEQGKLTSFVMKHKFWYIDIPRTSSTSVQATLYKTYGYPYGKSDTPGTNRINPGAASSLIPPHSLAWHVRSILSEELWNDIKTFTIVRNPYTWTVSLWAYSKKFGNLGLENDTLMSFLKGLKNQLNGPKEARRFFPTSYMQSDYITDTSGKQIVKEILKFENRPAIKQFLEELGCNVNEEEKLAVSGEAKDNLESAEKKMIHTIFEKDFDLFKY